MAGAIFHFCSNETEQQISLCHFRVACGGGRSNWISVVLDAFTLIFFNQSAVHVNELMDSGFLFTPTRQHHLLLLLSSLLSHYSQERNKRGSSSSICFHSFFYFFTLFFNKIKGFKKLYKEKSSEKVKAD